ARSDVMQSNAARAATIRAQNLVMCLIGCALLTLSLRYPPPRHGVVTTEKILVDEVSSFCRLICLQSLLGVGVAFGSGITKLFQQQKHRLLGGTPLLRCQVDVGGDPLELA